MELVEPGKGTGETSMGLIMMAPKYAVQEAIGLQILIDRKIIEWVGYPEVPSEELRKSSLSDTDMALRLANGQILRWSPQISRLFPGWISSRYWTRRDEHIKFMIISPETHLVWFYPRSNTIKPLSKGDWSSFWIAKDLRCQRLIQTKVAEVGKIIARHPHKLQYFRNHAQRLAVEEGGDVAGNQAVS